MGQPTSANRERVVILGASNVSRSIETLVGLSRQLHAGPLEILVAAGHGRSYGNWSSILGRSLPAIRQCGLWEPFDRAPDTATWALVTDIGNDLLYEKPPERIAAWVEDCLTRLTSRGARVVMTELPLANLQGLSAARFRFFRTLFVPGCRLSQQELAERAHRLNELLLQLAESLRISVVASRSDWYGLDPIHIRYRHVRRAWSEVLAQWNRASNSARRSRRSLRDAIMLRTRLPAERRLGRITQRHQQPAFRWSDGTTIGFY